MAAEVFRGLHERPYPFHEDCEGCEGEVVPDPPLLDAAPNWPSDWQPPRRWGECTIRAPDGGVALHAEPGAEPVDRAEGGSLLSVLSEEGEWLQIAGQWGTLWARRAAFSPEAITAARLRAALEGLASLCRSPGAPLAAAACAKRQHERQQQGGTYAERTPGMLEWLFTLPGQWATAELGDMLDFFPRWKFDRERFFESGGCRFHPGDIVCSSRSTWQHLPRTAGTRMCCATRGAQEVLERMLSAVDPTFEPVGWAQYAFWVSEGRKGSRPEPPAVPTAGLARLSAHDMIEGVLAVFLYAYDLQCPNDFGTLRMLDLPGEGPPGWSLSELVVKSITKGSRAELAQVQRKDMVIAVGGTAVISDSEVAERVKRATTIAVVRPAAASRPVQYYTVLTLMNNAADAGDRAELVRRALSVFKPFIWRLDRFLCLVDTRPARLFRGMCMTCTPGLYHNGMTFFIHSFGSFSESADVCAKFTGESFGLFMTVYALRAFDAAFCSLFPVEKELVLGPNTRVEVCDNSNDVKSCLETPADTLTLRQKPECDDEVLSAEEALWQLIDGRRAQLSLSHFRKLNVTYVEPRIWHHVDGAELRLVQAFEGFVSSDAQWLVLVGSPGGGKSMALLWLYARYLSTSSEQGQNGRVPFFFNLSLVSDIAKEDGWVRRRVCNQLAVDEAGWRLLCGRQMMVFADSADQSVAPSEALRQRSLAARSELPPGSKCCISVRDVDMQCMGLDPTHYGGVDCIVFQLLPFQHSERRQLCLRVGENAAAQVPQQLRQAKATTSEERWTQALQGLPGCHPSDELCKYFLQNDHDKFRRYAEQAAALTEQRLASLDHSVADSTLLYTMSAEVAHELPEGADAAAVLKPAFERQLRRRVACVGADTWMAFGCSSQTEQVEVLMRVAEAVAAALTLAKQWSGQIMTAVEAAAPLCEVRGGAAALLPLVPGLPLRTVSADDPTALFALKHPVVQEWLAKQWAARAPARGHGEEARKVLEVLKPGWAGTYGYAEANRQRLRWISIAYAAVVSIIATNWVKLSPSSERYLRGLRLRRCLQELRSGAALILRPVEHALPSFPGGEREGMTSSGQAGQDTGELGAAEDSEESQKRMQGGAQEAQEAAAGICLAEFGMRAKTVADADYPPAPEITEGAVVRAVAADPTSDVLSHSPVPQLPIGELAEVTASPAGELVQTMVITPEGSVNNVSLPVAHLRCIASRLQVLQWARNFPEQWESKMGDPSFRAVDINCEPYLLHENRRAGNKKPAICCLRRSLEHIAGGMLGTLADGKAEWIDPLHSFLAARGSDGIEALQEGIAAAHIFSLEMLDPRKKARKTQIYRVLNDAMRNNWDEQLKPDTDSAHRLALFAPLIVHLSDFTSRMAQEVGHKIVYRGINAIVAQGYKPGADFVWGCFSSTTEKSKTCQSFSSGVGTLFVLRERKAAPIVFCSMFPSEAERVLPPAKFKVLTRMPETTLCVAETRNDIVIAEEVTDTDSQKGLAEEAEVSVQLRTKAHRSAGFIFETFAGRFVEPRLRIGEAEVSLFAHFDGAGKEDRVTLLHGDGGTGKTSVMLALLEHMIRLSDDAQVTPIFVHCPWAAGLLTELEPVQHKLSDQDPGTLVGPIVHAICAALALRTAAELRVLKEQHLVVLLDSLDECAVSEDHGPGELLTKIPLLSRGGVDLKDWPRTRFVICCRKEFLEVNEQMLDSGRTTICEIQPFTTEERREYVKKLATQEVRQLIRRLPKTTDVATAVSEMRCAMRDAGAANELREALAKEKQAEVHAASASEEDKEDAAAAVKRANDIREAASSAAVQQCVEGINAVLECLPTELLKIPFVLYLACSASKELADADLHVAPRFRVYTAWVRRDIADRIARAPELAKFMPPTLDRADRLEDKVSVLAVRMFALGGGWHSDVGSCVEMLGGADMARAVLGVLPLRVESVERNECRVTWRHRTVQEFAIARALIYPERTSAADWDAALTGPLDTTPETEKFFAEGVATLSDAEKAILTQSLRTATRGVKAARKIASVADTVMQQQQQPHGVSEAAQPDSVEVPAGPPGDPCPSCREPPSVGCGDVSKHIAYAMAAVLATRPDDPVRELAVHLEQPLSAPPPPGHHSESAGAYLQRHRVPEAIVSALDAAVAEHPQSPVRLLARSLAGMRSAE